MAPSVNQAFAQKKEYSFNSSSPTSEQVQPPSTSESSSVPVVEIPDRRRNSCGEHMHSPNETWRPNVGRKQSWDPEDLKRENCMKGLRPVMGKDALGEEKGFTEEPFEYAKGGYKA